MPIGQSTVFEDHLLVGLRCYIGTLHNTSQIWAFGTYNCFVPYFVEAVVDDGWWK